MGMLKDGFKDAGFVPALIIVIVLAIALQLTGVWVTMLIAGAFGGLFTRRHLRAFLAGFLGVGVAWSIIFLYLIGTTPAIAIAGFFIGLLGLGENLGIIVIVIAIIIGALLGGFGGIMGRAVFELVESRGVKEAQAGKTEEARSRSRLKP